MRTLDNKIFVRSVQCGVYAIRAEESSFCISFDGVIMACVAITGNEFCFRKYIYGQHDSGNVQSSVQLNLFIFFKFIRRRDASKNR